MASSLKTLNRVRDYGEVVERLGRISRRHKLALTTIGEASGYPVFSLESAGRMKPTDLFVSAGTHGDEPASLEAQLRWLEQGDWKRLPHNIFVLPCINPWGHEHDTRENEKGLDINREFRSTRCVEAEIVKRALKRRCFTLSIELHEDVDSPGFYLYEIKAEPPFLGETIVKAVERLGPVNRARVIEGLPSKHGVIRPPHAASRILQRKRWPLAFYLYAYHSQHKLTFETPGPLDFELRVGMQLAALNAAMRSGGL